MKTAKGDKPMHNSNSLRASELNPELFGAREREARKQARREIIGMIIAVAFTIVAFAFIQISYGVW